MSGTISENERSKSPESSSTELQEYTRTIKRLKDVAELWLVHADNEYDFGVVKGLLIAIDALEGR